jgi:hypothetical protein
VPPQKTAVLNGATKQDRKVRAISSCSDASVHTIASDCCLSDHGSRVDAGRLASRRGQCTNAQLAAIRGENAGSARPIRVGRFH